MDFKPSNELEQVLSEAAKDPAVRPKFYQMLMGSELFVLTPPSDNPAGPRVLEADENVQMISWKKDGQDVIPIFTSLPLLESTIQSMGSGPVGYLAMRGKALFDVLGGGTISAMLNPNCPAGKEFLVHEMRDMASGKFFETPAHVVPKQRRILLGQPAEYPHELMDVLKRYLVTQPQVEALYLAQMADPESGDPPHLIFGVKMQGTVDAVMGQLVTIARETLGPDKMVDFTVVTGRSGSLNDYFLKTGPVYQRVAGGSPATAPKSFFKRLMGG